MAVLTAILALLTTPIIASLLWLDAKVGSQCETLFLEIPVLALAAVLTILILVGVIGLCVPWVKRVYWILTFLMILLLMSFSIFVLVVTEDGSGEVVRGTRFKEYKLEDYSHWLQKTISADKNWNQVRRCLQYEQVCRSLSEQVHVSPQQFFRLFTLTPIQSGCCKPPIHCGFIYKSPTSWDNTWASTSRNPDCKAWANSPGFCFECQSCKAGVLTKMKKGLREVAYISITFLILMIIVYLVQCSYSIRKKKGQIADP